MRIASLLLVCVLLQGCVFVGYERYPSPRSGAVDVKGRSEMTVFHQDPAIARPELAPGVTATLSFGSAFNWVAMGPILPVPLPVIPLPPLVATIADVPTDSPSLFVSIESRREVAFDPREVVIVDRLGRHPPVEVKEFEPLRFWLRYDRKARWSEPFQVILGGLRGSPARRAPVIEFGPGAAWVMFSF